MLTLTSPKGGSKTQCPKFKQQSAIISKIEVIGSRIRSFDWYRLQWPWM